MRLTKAVGTFGALVASLALNASAQGIPRAEIKLDDSFILGTRARVDQEELETARWATTHAANKNVRTFAQSLLRGHSAAQETAKRLADRLKVELSITGEQDSTIGRREADTKVSLRSLKGSAFDRVFLTSVRDQHTREIAQVNGWYQSTAASDSVKTYLRDIMPTLVKHEMTADKLLASTNKTVAAR